MINPINFTNYYPPKTLLERLGQTPKTNQEANEYFLTVDEARRNIPQDSWDNIYALKTDDKIQLADYLKATYLTTRNYTKQELLNPKAISPTINKLLSCERILTQEEIEKIEKKTQGAFEPEKIERYFKCGFEKSEEFLGNLWFLKELAQEENQDIFEAMSPRTVVKILLNFLYSYNDFSTSLDKLREDDALTMPKTDFWTTKDEVKAYQREVIHEYFLGESYNKISKSDYRLSQLEHNRPSVY